MTHTLCFKTNQDLDKDDIKVSLGFPCNSIQSGAKQCNAGVLDNSDAMEVALEEVRGSEIQCNSELPASACSSTSIGLWGGLEAPPEWDLPVTIDIFIGVSMKRCQKVKKM